MLHPFRVILLYYAGLLVILLALAATSCTTTKYVDRVKVVTDSMVIQQNENLQHALHETVKEYEKRLEESNGVLIEYDTIQLPGDTVRLPGRVTIDRSGVISAEGNLKRVSITAQKLLQERDSAYGKLEAVSIERDSLASRLQRTDTVVHKEVRRGLPFWWWLVMLSGWGMWALPKIKRLINPFLYGHRN